MSTCVCQEPADFIAGRRCACCWNELEKVGGGVGSWSPLPDGVVAVEAGLGVTGSWN